MPRRIPRPGTDVVRSDLPRPVACRNGERRRFEPWGKAVSWRVVMRGAVVVLCTLPAPRIAPQGAGAAALDADITPAVLVQMNALRRQNGLATLERVPLLDT